MAERQLKIISQIQNKGSVQVEELAKDLNVSAMTIRRDLEKLDEEGIVERCHGGAVAKFEINYQDKQISNSEEKVKLAEICANFVKEGDTIFLDAGTTTYEIAKLIQHVQGISVITNDLEMTRLLNDSDVELVICGGYVQKGTGSIHGYSATQMMEGFRFDIGFFGAAAIDKNFHVMTPTVDKAFFKKQLVSQCQKTFLVADKSKFNKVARAFVNELTDYTYIVTEYQFQEQERTYLERGTTKILSLV